MEEKNILSSIINYLKPKAHDAIDGITTQWKKSQSFADRLTSDEQLNEIVQNFVMGSVGGVGKKVLRGKDAYMANLKKMAKRDTPLTGKKLVDMNTRLGGKGKTLEDLKKFAGGEGDFFKNKIRSLFDDLSDVEF